MCEVFHTHNPFNLEECHKLSKFVIPGDHGETSVQWYLQLSPPNSGELDQYLDVWPLMKMSVTIGTSKFFVICQKHCEFNSLNLLVNSVLPLVSVFTAFDRKCFTQSLAELPSCKISAAQPVLREETTLLIIKIQHKVSACPSLNLLENYVVENNE